MSADFPVTPQRITDFRVFEFYMTQQQYQALPPKVQTLLRWYAIEYPQGMGKPSRFELPASRWEELQAAYQEATGERFPTCQI